MKGSVRRRPSGDWEYRFDAESHPLTGRRQRLGKSGFQTQREAAKALRQAIAADEKGRTVRVSHRTVRSFLDEWHAAVQPALRATTWANYRTYLNAYVLPAIGDSRLQELTPVRLNLLYAHLLKDGRTHGPGGLAPKTVQNVHRMLHRALRDGVKWDLLARNVAEDAQPPHAARPKPHVWNPAQLRDFVDHVRGDRFFALWLLVVTTGLRRGELAGLTAEDIDLVHARVAPGTTRVVVDGYAQTSRTKTASGERNLALDPDTAAALAGYLRTWGAERAALEQSTRLLFVWADGRPVHPDTITALFHRHCTTAGLPRIRLHDVRHSYATAALQAGIPAKVISERLGHATAAFTLQTYTHVIPGMDQDAADSVASLILRPEPQQLDREGRRSGRMILESGPTRD